MPNDGFEHEPVTLIEKYATFSIALSDLRFSGYGSLYPMSGDGYTVGPLIATSRFNRLQAPYWYGPFKSTRDRYITQIGHVLEHIGLDGFYDDEPVTACLVHLLVAEMLDMDSEKRVEESKFYLKHADMYNGQILVRGGNISAILDWEW
jgi:hypothetical protein